jgi:hypothetical protein
MTFISRETIFSEEHLTVTESLSKIYVTVHGLKGLGFIGFLRYAKAVFH